MSDLSTRIIERSYDLELSGLKVQVLESPYFYRVILEYRYLSDWKLKTPHLDLHVILLKLNIIFHSTSKNCINTKYLQETSIRELAY